MYLSQSWLTFLSVDSKQWTRVQMEGDHPVERSGHSAVAHEGIMYIWGGQNEGNYFNDLFMFNSSTCKYRNPAMYFFF